MRKYLTIVLAFVLFACTVQLDEISKSVPGQATPDASALALMKRSHAFPFDSAALLVSNLLAIPNLNKTVATYGGGGTFPASLFQVSTENAGIIFWYGFDARKKEIFLALEQLKSYDVHNMPTHPMSKTLYRPLTTFKNTVTGQPEKTTVKNNLARQVISDNGVVTIDNVTLTRHMNSFDSLLARMPDANGERYNKYLFSFFHDKRDGLFETFTGQGGKNGLVRYYFGYDEHDVPNRIRVVLIAVDANGRNVTAANGAARTNGDDGLTLQRSWPPPAGN